MVRRQTPVYAVSGVIGVAIAGYVASRTGKAENFFLPGLLLNVAYATAYLVSIAVRWPLIGVIVAAVGRTGNAWRDNPDRLRAYTRASWVWVGLFLSRIAVQLPLYLAGALVALGTARVAMGVPLFVVGAWLSWLVLRNTEWPRERSGGLSGPRHNRRSAQQLRPDPRDRRDEDQRDEQAHQDPGPAGRARLLRTAGRAARHLRAPRSACSSTSRAAVAARTAGTSTSRGPAARKSGTSKPRRAAQRRRDALLEQQALDELGLGLVAAPATRTSSPSVYCGLTLRARSLGSVERPPRRLAVDERHARSRGRSARRGVSRRARAASGSASTPSTSSSTCSTSPSVDELGAHLGLALGEADDEPLRRRASRRRS